MTTAERKFVRTVWDYYSKQGRHDLPWRKTHSPYRILVSEVMLQQTQVERVIPKYREFLKQFPTLSSLAESSLSEVLLLWQGLGYNRRAKMLHENAKTAVKIFRGHLPHSSEKLVTLPGIGPYTAGAIMAFAYSEPVPFIETNIRSAYIHHFFTDKNDVSDSEIFRLIEKTLDRKNPREWYYALMDYGASIKKKFGNPNSRSKHYARQSRFKGSDREIRGALLRLLLKGPKTRTALLRELPFEDVRVDMLTEKLLKEGLIYKTQGRYMLPH